MLETIRAFAGEQLDRSGEREAMERARLAWLRDLAAETGLAHSHRGFGSAWTLDPIAAELGEIRGALGWGLEHAPAEALDVAACFEGFWVVRAPLEGAAWLDRLLRRAQDADPAVRACALRAQAGATEITGDFDGVSELYAESASLFAAVGDTVNALQLEFRVCANRVNLAVHAWNASTPDPELLAALTAELARFAERFAALERAGRRVPGAHLPRLSRRGRR